MGYLLYIILLLHTQFFEGLSSLVQSLASDSVYSRCSPGAVWPCCTMCSNALCVVQCLCKGPQALFLLILKLFTQPDDSVDDVDGGISVIDDDICLSVCNGNMSLLQK